jgi:acetoin utilization protein AcuC
VDIDAYHGDGVYYSFVDDPNIIIVDFHEDGRYLYPGTGHENETGEGVAKGTKMNIPLAPDSEDAVFTEKWRMAEAFLEQFQPEFVILQCGADSIAGDSITHLRLTDKSHAYAAERLCYIAKRYSQGRLLALGGGGYRRENLAEAWCAVIKTMSGTT